MLGRIRRDRGYPDDEPSIQGVGSLLGGDGVSLDGESLVLPSEYDDMSSINTNTLADQQGAFRIVGHDVDDSTLMGGVEDAPKDPDEDEEGAAAGGACLPLWLTDAPTWLKAAIVVSTALLVGAIVLVGVAAALNGDDKDSESTSRSIGGNAFVPIDRSVPSPTPSAVPTVTSAAPTKNPTTTPTKSPTKSPQPSSPGDTPQPSAAPTPEPTSFPTALPTQGPTGEPTVTPSLSPTSIPTLVPTSIPTLVPSVAPVRVTLAPVDITPSPVAVTPAPVDITLSPVDVTPSPVAITSAPVDVTPSPVTLAPVGNSLSGSRTVFYLVAGRPLDGELEEFQRHLPNLPTEADFMVHLGDWNSPFSTECDEESYQQVSLLYEASAVPVYFIPGDNEYNDCPNIDQAFGFWEKYLLGYDSKFWPSRWTVDRFQPDYPENFAFVMRNILYVGINLVGGRVHDDKEWEDRQKANLQWIDSSFQKHQARFDVLILFAHADPDIETNSDFFTPLFQRIEFDYRIPTILIHRNLGVESSSIEENFDDIPDFVVLVAEGGIWPPMRVEIDTITGNFVWDQENWFDV